MLTEMWKTVTRLFRGVGRKRGRALPKKPISRSKVPERRPLVYAENLWTAFGNRKVRSIGKTVNRMSVHRDIEQVAEQLVAEAWFDLDQVGKASQK